MESARRSMTSDASQVRRYFSARRTVNLLAGFNWRIERRALLLVQHPVDGRKLLHHESLAHSLSTDASNPGWDHRELQEGEGSGVRFLKARPFFTNAGDSESYAPLKRQAGQGF